MRQLRRPAEAGLWREQRPRKNHPSLTISRIHPQRTERLVKAVFDEAGTGHSERSDSIGSIGEVCFEDRRIPTERKHRPSPRASMRIAMV